MLHTDAKSMKERGDRLFSAKASFDRRNQDIAENFYPERADFTVARDVGDDFAGRLMTGYPVMVRRDLGNSIGSMLRPKGRNWFSVRGDREEREDHEAKLWLEWSASVMRRAMYDHKAMLTRATKETDHDFSAFGGGVISVDVNRRDTALLYRNWHLRDVAWEEDAYGQICGVHRNWKPAWPDHVSAIWLRCRRALGMFVTNKTAALFRERPRMELKRPASEEAGREM